MIRHLFWAQRGKRRCATGAASKGTHTSCHLIEQLPPSATVFDAYIAFFTTSANSHYLTRLSNVQRLKAGDPKELLKNSNTLFRLEVILQRYVYPKPLLLNGPSCAIPYLPYSTLWSSSDHPRHSDAR